MSKRYLVTGGAGFIGSALVRRLLADGHAVRVLDDGSRGQPARLNDIAKDIEIHLGDVRDTATVAAAARGMDGVIHLAAVNGTEFFYSRQELVLDVGVRGTLAVVDACRKHGIGDLVIASSSEVYQSPAIVPTDESAPLIIPDIGNPRYSYAGSKILSELIAFNYGGFERVLVFRPHNVYGPAMGWEHVVPQFAMRLADAVAAYPAGKVPMPIQGDGSQTRAFIHIDDFTDGLVLLLAKGGNRELYHIGTEEEVTMADLARLIAAHFGREIALIPGPEPKGATPRRCPAIGKLRKLGFDPKIRLADGVGKVADWYAANRHHRPQQEPVT
jgi:dTDP-glucose 4,6-dehydratase/UDP-glucose 4-epimerase